jgi:hypothetical protein
MKRYLLLASCFLLLGAAPSRLYNYEYGKPWKASEVNENEAALYRYLATGVDTYADGTITNDDISNDANIQSEKLNMKSISTKFRFANGSKLIIPTKKNRPDKCEQGEIYLNTTLPAIEVCVADNLWETL